MSGGPAFPAVCEGSGWVCDSGVVPFQMHAIMASPEWFWTCRIG